MASEILLIDEVGKCYLGAHVLYRYETR